jgi:NhaA family Na+:H+ antiporter
VIIRPFRIFARHKASGALVLLAATALAVAWANTPWGEAYLDLLATPLTVGVGSWAVAKPLLLWINDGLMGIFFFVIGLELKRELVAGQLSVPRRALLPIAGALGGMVVPAAIYMALNGGDVGRRGWGVPMATDIAFALGILALAGNRVPTSVKVLLTALAIVDDLGAILVIALFYTSHIGGVALAIAAALLGVSLAANRLGVRNQAVFLLFGTLMWFAFLQSGVHATLAAVLMAFTIPARTRTDGVELLSGMDATLASLRALGPRPGRSLRTPDEQNALEHMADMLDDATAPLQRIEHELMPIVTFFVLPVFALANAGVALGTDLGAALAHPVALGISAGLLLGKPLGILGFAWLAVRVGWAALPEGATWAHLRAVAVLGGVGFTMALFISGLALERPALQESAKVGILLSSLVAGLVGWAMLRRMPERPAPAGGAPGVR